MVPVTWYRADQNGCIWLSHTGDELPVETLRRFLGRWVETDSAYFHGKAVKTAAGRGACWFPDAGFG